MSLMEALWPAMSEDAKADGGDVSKERLYWLIRLDSLAAHADRFPGSQGAIKIQEYLERLPGWGGAGAARSVALEQHYWRARPILEALYPDEKISLATFGLI